SLGFAHKKGCASILTQPLRFFKTTLSFPKKRSHTPHLKQVIKYSVYICKLSTVRATFQQNEHCFAKT
ncbi:hypothetical protein, partial [uncultured Parabacteroides sp.]